jgi:hypothetical protein
MERDWLAYYQQRWEDPEDDVFWSRADYYGHGDGDEDNDSYESDFS